MAHEHHHHAPEIKETNKAFLIGIGLNVACVLVQVIVGLRINSLSLLSDAGHNFIDVAGLALALLAFKLSQSKATVNYSYGYKKASILISLINTVTLLISVFIIAYEALFRFKNPAALPGKTIAIVAAVGIAINGISAMLFLKNKENDINIKAAFLHLIADALMSFAILVGGIIIYYTQLYWIDPLLSLVICAFIVVSSWGLLKDSLRLSLDGVPDTIDVEKIREEILKVNGVRGVHHLHIWAISTTQNALTAHILVDDDSDNASVSRLKKEIKHELEHLNIQHATLEIECENAVCAEVSCNH